MNRSIFTRMRKTMKVMIVVATIATLSTMVLAEQKPWPVEHLKKHADVIVVGNIAKVAHQDKAKPSGYVERYYDLEIAIEKVEKGKLAQGQKSIDIKAWAWIKWPEDRSKWVSGSFGQYPLYTTEGTRVRLYLGRSDSGELKIIPPNGMEKLTTASGDGPDAKQPKQRIQAIEVFVDLSLGLCDEQAAKKRLDSLKAENLKAALKEEIEGLEGDLVGIRQVSGEQFVALTTSMETVSSGMSIVALGASNERAYLEVNIFLTSQHRYVAVVTTELPELPKEVVKKLKQ